MRILTWNACGDIGQKAQAKAGELSRVLEYWESSDPIAIVCLQEVNAEHGTLCRRLKDLDWQIKWIEEQADGGGRHQVIAVCPGLRIDDFDVVDLSEYEDSETIANSPCRTPCCADITLSDGRVLTVVTWHATLGSRKEDHLQGLSQYTQILSTVLPGGPIILAADFNCDVGRINDPRIFPGYQGYSFRLDHILATNIALIDGKNSTEGNSDHELVSAHIVL